MEYCFGSSAIWMWKRESGGACQVQTPLLQAHLEQNHHINCQLMCLHAARINPWEKSAGPGHAVSRRGVVFFCWRSSGRRCGAKCGGEGGSLSWKQAAEGRLWVGFVLFPFKTDHYYYYYCCFALEFTGPWRHHGLCDVCGWRVFDRFIGGKCCTCALFEVCTIRSSISHFIVSGMQWQ